MKGYKKLFQRLVSRKPIQLEDWQQYRELFKKLPQKEKFKRRFEFAAAAERAAAKLPIDSIIEDDDLILVYGGDSSEDID